MTLPVTLSFDRRPSAAPYMLRAVWPGARPRELAPCITARWQGHRVDQRELAAFLAITGLREGPALPLLYPHTFGFRLKMAILTHPRFPVPIWGVLQTRNHLVQHRPIEVGARLDFETRVATARVLEKGAEIDLHTAVRAEGVVAWESLITFYTRGRFGGPVAPSPLARAPAQSCPLPLVAEWRLKNSGHWQLGNFTGDYNGIHFWRWYARRFGFARAIYHPPRVLGECLARLPQLDPRQPHRLDVWLKGPVPHGAKVRLQATKDAFLLYAEGDKPSIVGQLSEDRKLPSVGPFTQIAEISP